MSDYETYRKELKESEVFFESRISDRQNKAYEYGALVVRNSILVSGGSLLAIPAIVGLSTNIDINLAKIVIAGFAFAFGLLTSTLASYIIHWNWNLHAQAWEKYWEDRQETLKKIYLDGVPNEQIDLEPKKHFNSLITWTYVIPHILAVVYIISVGYGFIRLYEALGVNL